MLEFCFTATAFVTWYNVSFEAMVKSVTKNGRGPNASSETEPIALFKIALPPYHRHVLRGNPSELLVNFRDDEAGGTFLHVACVEGWTVVVEEFAKTTSTFRQDIVNQLDLFRCTALHICCHRGCIREASICLESRADPNIVNAAGYTPLMLAAGAPNGYVVFELLFAYGADPKGGGFPLCHCISSENASIQFLLRLINLHRWTDMCFFYRLSPTEMTARLAAGRHISHRPTIARACEQSISRSVLESARGASDLRNANLVIAASQQWSVTTHHLWPPHVRKYVKELLLVGSRLKTGILDVWIDNIVPHVVGQRVTRELWSVLIVSVAFVQKLLRSRRLATGK